jgi:hypothetical protein
MVFGASLISPKISIRSLVPCKAGTVTPTMLAATLRGSAIVEFYVDHSGWIG